MNKAKRKNSENYRDRMLMGVVLFVIVKIAVFALIGEAISTPKTNEYLSVSFTTLSSTCTQRLYSKNVFLFIQGEGQAAGEDWSDAFYLYTRNGQPLDEPLTEMFDLEIDGDRAIYTLGLEDNPPTYNREHIYQVNYDVGELPRKICFRISDSNVGDNSGAFHITISARLSQINSK